MEEKIQYIEIPTRVEQYVDKLENKSSINIDKMVRVCKRVNNTKRDYLFVNNMQGKHIPNKPREIKGMFKELLKEVELGIDKTERILVVGFAETATSIGQYIGDRLSNCVYKLQTTREEIKGKEKTIQFEEEHSHAVGQWMYIPEDIPEYDRVLFVEDEITTGNTIINFIKEFERIKPGTKYAVASILNWQNKEKAKQFKERGIDVYFVVRGEIRDGIEPIGIPDKCFKGYKDIGLIECLQVKGGVNERLGTRPGSSDSIIDKVTRELEGKLEGRTICILGTEEYMYIPLEVAERIERLGFKVKYHSTTRSPVVLSKVEGYSIREGMELESVYEKGRKTYLYNMEHYDNIVVITDAAISGSFLESLRVETEKLIFIEVVE